MKKNTTKKRRREPDEITIYLPPGAQPQDKFEASTIPDTSLSDIGVQLGDVAIIFRTSRIRRGDLILCEVSGRRAYIGKYCPALDGLIHLEPLNDEYKTEIFSPNKLKVQGRVVRFDRDGQAVPVKMELRPVRQTRARSKTNAPATDERHTEIARLENKLERLLDEGDITDSTQCFQLEKRIYDLKREIARDEWPEVIGDE